MIRYVYPPNLRFVVIQTRLNELSLIIPSRLNGHFYLLAHTRRLVGRDWQQHGAVLDRTQFDATQWPGARIALPHFKSTGKAQHAGQDSRIQTA